MKKVISEKVYSEYTCYCDCAENVVYFCGIPVMKIFQGFYEPGRKPSYCYTNREGGSIPNLPDMTREKFFSEIERLKSYKGIPSDFPYTA